MHTFATIVSNNQTLAQRYFPGYFAFGLSASGLEPATHWATTGPFDNDELENIANGQSWVEGIGFGIDPRPLLKKLGLIAIAPIAAEADPVTPVTPVPPASVSKRQAKTLMELTPHPAGNLWLAALAAADAIPDPVTRIVTRNYITDSQVYEAAKVQEMCGLLGMAPEQADQMLIAAAKL